MGRLERLGVVAGVTVVLLAVGAGCAEREGAMPRGVGGDEVQTLPLKYADAVEMAQLINAVFDPTHAKLGGLDGGGRVYAVGDRRANILVLTGPSELIKLALDLVKRMDEGGEGAIFFSYQLKNAQAAQLAPVLDAVFRDGPPGVLDVRPLPPGLAEQHMVVVAEPGSNALILGGVGQQYENAIRMIIDQMDRPLRQVRLNVLVVEVAGNGAADSAASAKGLDAGLDENQVASLLRDLGQQGMRVVGRSEIVGQERHEIVMGGLRLMPRVNGDRVVTLEVSGEVAGLGVVKTTVAVGSGKTVILRGAMGAATQKAGGDTPRTMIVMITATVVEATPATSRAAEDRGTR